MKPNFFPYTGNKEKLKEFLKNQKFNACTRFGVDKSGNSLIKLYLNSKLKAVICLSGTSKLDEDSVNKVAYSVGDVIQEVLS